MPLRTWCALVTCFILSLSAAAQTRPASPQGRLLATLRGKVDAKMNVFAAGHAKPPDGLMPATFVLPAGKNRVFVVKKAAGKVSCCGSGGPFNGADGGHHYRTNISSTNGIAGLINEDRAMFLTGVFLGDDEPKDPAPAPLNVTKFESQKEIAPALQQVFFMGDGLTGEGTGAVQQFDIPDGATRLCLGFADANGFGGPPGAYGDNVGEIDVVLEVRQGNRQFEVTQTQGKIGITMNDSVLFATAQNALKPQAQDVLAKIKAAVLDMHPESKIQVEGHTDDVGDDAYNQQLSQKRADAVATWLKAHGVATERISAVGYGKTKPKVPNTSAANRAQNRRVEIKLQ